MYAFIGIEWCKWSCAQYFFFISIVSKLLMKSCREMGLTMNSLRKCSHTL